ncbi:MAG: glutamine synthetase type III, partial [Planctomycetota bacterium]|nr:glutamine synthetase type III [Planctomycetota bacterium]
LPNLQSTVDALPTLKSKKALNLFSKYRVLNNRELRARVEVLWDQYNMILGIEARTMVSMLKTQVMPAALRHQTELAEAVAATQAAGVDCESTRAGLQELVDMIDELREATQAVQQAETHQLTDSQRQARHIRDSLIPAMDRARAASDALESVIPADLWTLPTYGEMLFLR